MNVDVKATWRDWQVTENEGFCWLESIKQISPCDWLWPRNTRQEETAWLICNATKQFAFFLGDTLHATECNVMTVSWRKIYKKPILLEQQKFSQFSIISLYITVEATQYTS